MGNSSGAHMNEERLQGVDFEEGRERLLRSCDIEYRVDSGPGGQHRNKKATAVRITHRPTGIVVQAAERRSRQQNLAAAVERLIARLRDLRTPKKERRPTKIPKGVQRRRLERKRRRSEKLKNRRIPNDG